MAFEQLEKRVSETLPYSQNYHRTKIPALQSGTQRHYSSIPSDTADVMARSISSSKKIPYRYKALPPISHQQQTYQQQLQQQQHRQKQRLNGHTVLPNKSEQLIEHQRRIARLIKHIK